MKRFLKVALFACALYGFSCQQMPFGNPCADERLMEDLKTQTAVQVWAINNPEEALMSFFTGAFSVLTGGPQKLEGELLQKIKPIAEELKVEDVSKPQKLSEDSYKCSAILRYRETQFAVSYTLTLIHSGKEKVYRVDVEEVSPVR